MPYSDNAKPIPRYDKSVTHSKPQQALGALKNLALDVTQGVTGEDPSLALLGGSMMPVGMALKGPIGGVPRDAVAALMKMLRSKPAPKDAARQFLGELSRGTPNVGEPFTPELKFGTGGTKLTGVKRVEMPGNFAPATRAEPLEALRDTQQAYYQEQASKPLARPPQADRRLVTTGSQRHINVAKARAKLSEDQVRDIRTRATQGEPIKDLSKAFGSNDATVREIVKGQAYRWVKDE